ncbi:hypothetical protein D3C83_210240 [compost metagenome]
MIFSLLPDEKKPVLTLKVESQLPRDLVYKAEMRSLTRKQRFPGQTSPVVAGKMAFETFPKEMEELAVFDFKLEK